MTAGSSTPRTTRRRARTSGCCPTPRSHRPTASRFRCCESVHESQGQISPDGKWLAYFSDESGTNQIYLRPFDGRLRLRHASGRSPPEPSVPRAALARGRKRTVLPGAGLGQGSPDTRSCPCRSARRRILRARPSAVRIPVHRHRSAGKRVLYAPAADGQRFLINVIRHRGPTLARGDPELGQDSEWQVDNVRSRSAEESADPQPDRQCGVYQE